MDAKRVYQVIIEQDEAGLFVAECPALKACYAQGQTYEQVMVKIRDVIAARVENYKAKGIEPPSQSEIVGIKRLEFVA